MAVACDISTPLLANANILGPLIYAKRTPMLEPWDMLVKRETFANGIGFIQKFTRIERAVPPSVNYTAITGGSNGLGDTPCDPAQNRIAFPGLTSVAINLEKAELYTDAICLDDIVASSNAAQVLDAIVESLADQVRWIFAVRHMTEFTRVNTNKVIAMSGAPQFDPVGTSAFPLTEPTSQITENKLLYWWTQLQFRGGQRYALGNANGGAIYALILGFEAAENLIKSNPDLRQDVRFANPSLLIQALGTESTTFRNFKFFLIEYPQRWVFSGGAWVEVPPYLNPGSSATVGYQQEVNPDYLTAPYEDVYIFTDIAYRMLVPETPDLTWGNGKISYGPQQYSGEWQFINDRLVGCDASGNTLRNNLFKNSGFFAAQLKFGTINPRPELGVTIRARRCGFADDSVNCYGS